MELRPPSPGIAALGADGSSPRVAHVDLARAMNALYRSLAPPPPEMSIGDLDGDGFVDARDLALLLEALALGADGSLKPGDALFDLADLNGDGVIDAADIEALARLMGTGGRPGADADDGALNPLGPAALCCGYGPDGLCIWCCPPECGGNGENPGGPGGPGGTGGVGSGDPGEGGGGTSPPPPPPPPPPPSCDERGVTSVYIVGCVDDPWPTLCLPATGEAWEGLYVAVGAPTGGEYAWSVSGGTIEGDADGPAVVVKVEQPGTMSVQVTYTVDGCSATDECEVEFIGVTITNLPDPPILCVSPDPGNDPNWPPRITLTAAGTPGGGTYQWSVGSGAAIVGAANTASAVIAFPTPGHHTVQVTYEPPDDAPICIAVRTITGLRVGVNGPAQTTEGLDSAEFVAVLTPSDVQPNSFQWSAEWPQGVGHTPGVHFAAPIEQTTNVLKAAWFADPDSRWRADTGMIAKYDISVAANAEGIVCPCEPVEWEVRVMAEGFVDVGPLYSGVNTVQVEQNPQDNLWYVTGQGAFQRDTNALVAIVNAPPTSDFYAKVLAHENWHIHQYINVPPWRDLWNVDAFYANVLSQLPGQATEQDMRDLITLSYNLWRGDNWIEWAATTCEREWQAFEHEYNVNPRYQEIRQGDVPGIYQCSY